MYVIYNDTFRRFMTILPSFLLKLDVKNGYYHLTFIGGLSETSFL